MSHVSPTQAGAAVIAAALISPLVLACSSNGASPDIGGRGGAPGNGSMSGTSPGAGGGAAAGGAGSGVAGGSTGSSAGSGGNVPSGGGGASSSSDGGALGSSGAVNAGGVFGSGGVANTGGMAPGGVSGSSAPGGSTAACYSGPTAAVATTDYVSRKWARWPVPTPPSMRLPNPMKFTDLGNGTVRDEVTGLVWQATVDGSTRTWADAIADCENLGLDGGGWTLPTRMELTSILDDAQPSGARVNAAFFKFTTKAGWTWASTPWVVDSRKTVMPPLSWFINFSAGDSNNSLDQTAASAYDRCVRVPAAQTLPTTHYDVTAGEVADNYTCLVWERDSSASMPTLSWDQAVAYCQGLSLNGHTWRLPSLNELASVVDDVPSGNVSPAVDHAAFPNTNANAWYWSTTPYGSSTTEQWSLNFEDGFTKHQAKTVLGVARCVR